MSIRNVLFSTTAAVAGLLTVADVQAREADNSAELAKKLSNPVASLISVPFQYNHDSNLGSAERGSRSVFNIQPVVPFSVMVAVEAITAEVIP